MEFTLVRRPFSKKMKLVFSVSSTSLLASSLRAAGFLYPAFLAEFFFLAKCGVKETPPLGDLRQGDWK